MSQPTVSNVSGNTDYPTVGTLIVDDEVDIRLLIRMAIEMAIERWNRGMFVSAEVDDGESAIAGIAEADPAVVVLDQMMSGMDGLETAAHILRDRPGQPIVLFSADLDDAIERQAAEVGSARCVDKRDLSALPSILHELTRPS